MIEVIIQCEKCGYKSIAFKEDNEVFYPRKCKECNRKTKFILVGDKEQEKTEPVEEPKTEHEGHPFIKELKILCENAQNGTQNLLFSFLQAIESKHTGEGETALTALLYALNSIGGQGGMLKIEGQSSSGKTHLANTIIGCLPPQWTYKIGDFSENALKYIKWEKHKEVKILYIQEAGGAKESTVENMKLMSSDDGDSKRLSHKGPPAQDLMRLRSIFPSSS